MYLIHWYASPHYFPSIHRCERATICPDWLCSCSCSCIVVQPPTVISPTLTSSQREMLTFVCVSYFASFVHPREQADCVQVCAVRWYQAWVPNGLRTRLLHWCDRGRVGPRSVCKGLAATTFGHGRVCQHGCVRMWLVATEEGVGTRILLD
jgi:hypothetical protein